MNFEWDPDKARKNRRKHRVAFEEAATVFGDPFAVIYQDPDHSTAEERFITVGMSGAKRLLIVAHAERGEKIRIIARVRQRSARKNTMKKATSKRKKTDELRQEYDLAKLTGGVRGKYLERYRTGTNLVLLSPDVARYFRDGQSVDTALRTLIRTSKRQLRRAH